MSAEFTFPLSPPAEVRDGDRLAFDGEGRLRLAVPGDRVAFVFNSTFMKIVGSELHSDRSYFEGSKG